MAVALASFARLHLFAAPIQIEQKRRLDQIRQRTVRLRRSFGGLLLCRCVVANPRNRHGLPVFHRREKIMAPRREKITIEVDHDTREALASLASDEDRSLASFVRRTLVAYVARRQSRAAPGKRAA
jgi:hypothetical protein